MNLHAWSLKHSQKHIGSSLKLRRDLQGNADDGRSKVEKKEGLNRPT